MRQAIKQVLAAVVTFCAQLASAIPQVDGQGVGGPPDGGVHAWMQPAWSVLHVPFEPRNVDEQPCMQVPRAVGALDARQVIPHASFVARAAFRQATFCIPQPAPHGVLWARAT